MPKANSGRVSELDGWRGVSILLVLISHHLLFRFGDFVQPHKYFGWLAGTFGTVGVRTFFVISGFVITRQVLREERENGSISIRSFYIRRFFRIFPTYYLFLATVLVLGLIHAVPVTRGNVIGCALYLTDTILAHKSFVTSHSWSLAVEEQFYLVFPLLWALVKPARRVRWLWVTLGLSLAWSALAQANLLTQFFSASAATGFSCINLGVLLAVEETRVRRLAASVPPLLVLGGALFVFARPFPSLPLAAAGYVLLTPFCIGLVLLYTVTRKGWSAAVLNSGPMQWIGLVSYSTYVWQQLFVAAASEYGSPAIARFFHFPLLLPLVVVFSYYLVEKPTNRLGRRISQRQAAPVPMVTT